MKSLEGVKILIGPSTFGHPDPTPIKRLQEKGCTIIDNPFKRKLTKGELSSLLDKDVSGLIAGLELLDKEVIERANLKVISRCGSGISNIDMEAAKEFGVKVYNTPFGPTQAVAELTIGAMLSLLRMLPEMDRNMHNRKWTKRVGSQLKGKTITIIGFGRIGHRVASLLRTFQTKILGVDPYVNTAVSGVELTTLEGALPRTDIVTLHSGGEAQLIGSEQFDQIKPGALLLNAARGGLVDENALMDALDRERIRGAWLDTFEVEPYAGALCDYPQVILTPHIGSYTFECRRKMEIEAVQNLLEGFRVE